MRVNKFTTSTYFKSDKIREIDLNLLFPSIIVLRVTLDWILKTILFF